MMKTKLRKWEYMEERRCLLCGKKYVAKHYIAQSGPLKGSWIISSMYCSTKCMEKFDKKLEEVN